MSIRRLIVTTLCLLVGACTPPPPAQPDDVAPAPGQPNAAASDAAPEEGTEGELSQDNLPAAEQVFEKAVAAIGGREVLDGIGSFYSESKMEIPAQNMTASIRTWWKGGSFYMENDMPGVGMTKVWRNEGGVWSEDPINGRRKLEGKEARQSEWGATLSLVADWKRFFDEAETKARRKSGDLVLVDVLVTTEDGDQLTLSFEEDSGLLREQSFEQETPMGKMPITVKLEEYEEMGGFKQAARSVTNMAVVEAVTTLEKFEANVDIDPSRFVPDGDEGAKTKGAKTKGAKTKGAKTK